MARIRDGYIDTDAGTIPLEWKTSSLEKCCQQITDGSHFSPCAVDASDYYIATVTHMKNNGLNTETLTPINFDDFNLLEKNGCRPFNNDVLLSKDGTIGKVVLFNQYDNNVVLLSSIAILRTNRSILLPMFLEQILKMDKTLTRLMNLKKGSAIRRIILRDIKQLIIPIPPQNEQQKIAEILYAIDAHIEKLDKIIEDYQILKKGITKKLLTEGIGHTEFKETEIGRIPKEWEVVSLGQLFSLASGEGLQQKDIEDGNYPVYGGNGVIGHHNSYMFDKPMILIGRVGAKCGCVHYTQPKAWITDNALFIKQRKKQFDDTFMLNLLDFLCLNQYANQNAQPVISGGKIYPIEIAFPTYDEQKEIGQSILQLDKMIKHNIDKKEDYILLKRYLMEQLMTGKIRVNFLEV